MGISEKSTVVLDMAKNTCLCYTSSSSSFHIIFPVTVGLDEPFSSVVSVISIQDEFPEVDKDNFEPVFLKN